jgi:hypothetical protein
MSNSAHSRQVSEAAGIHYFWSAVASFMVLYIVNEWIFDRSNVSALSVFHIERSWESAPIFMLTFGSAISAIAFSILLLRIHHFGGATWTERMAPLWIDIDPRTSLGRAWRKLSAVVAIILPLAAQVQFWWRFHQWQAWPTTGVQQEVGLWSYEPISILGNWDAFHYGDYSKRALTDKGFGGVSFVPFWEPVMMVLLSTIVVILALRITIALFRPAR